MFIPAIPGSVLSRAALPKIEESIWYPGTGSSSPAGLMDTDFVGINLGVQFATLVAGEILSICYWRYYADAPSNGTVALWIARESVTPRTLLVAQDFTGHSGTGWKKVDLDTPIRVSTAESYFATLWVPSVDVNLYIGRTRYYFADGDVTFYSENGLVWAYPNSGAPWAPHDIYRRNGWFKYGAFACPDDQIDANNYWIDVVFRGSPVTIPPDPPIVLKWEIPEGYPNLDNTGIPPGTVLTPSVSITTTADGQIIEDRDFEGGGVWIRHHDCIVRRCKFYCRVNWSINIEVGKLGAIIEDCDINMGYRANGTAGGIGGAPLAIRRCNIYRGQDGIVGYSIYGGDGLVQQVYEDNFIHSLRSSPGIPHYDCVQFNGDVANILIRHNTLHNENSQTSTIFIQNLFGEIRGIRIEDNVMAGGGFNTYCVGRTDDPADAPIVVQYYNNQFTCGDNGYLATNPAGEPEMRGNRWMSHGGQYHNAPLEGFDVDQVVRERFFGMPNGSNTIPGSLSNDPVPGITLGLSFTLERDMSLTGVNVPKIRSPREELGYKVGVWRFTGANRTAGHVLLYQETIPMRGRNGWNYLPLTTPVSLLAGQNILVGVWHPPNAEGKVWYTAVYGLLDIDFPSQFQRATAFNGSGVPLGGFTGGNGLYAYGPDLAPPLGQGSGRPSYNIDPILEAPWTVDDNIPPEATNLDVPEGYFLNTPLNLTDIVVSDIDSPNVTATLTLSNPSAGSLNTATSGTVTSTYNAGTGVWTASGALANVNTLLAGLTFTPTTGFNGEFSIATSVSDGEAAPLLGTKSFEYVAPGSPTIPISYFDARFADNVPSDSVTMATGTLFGKSITDTGHTASVVATGFITVDTCRIDSREAVRMADAIDIVNCYLEALGEGDDHADVIQAYAPGTVGGVLNVTDTSIVAGDVATNAGVYIADDWDGTVTLNNVVFWGGPFGLRLHADPGCTINVSLTDVFFVGPFGYDKMLLGEYGGVINITHWENVRDATIVDGVLVLGALIPEP